MIRTESALNQEAIRIYSFILVLCLFGGGGGEKPIWFWLMYLACSLSGTIGIDTGEIYLLLSEEEEKL